MRSSRAGPNPRTLRPPSAPAYTGNTNLIADHADGLVANLERDLQPVQPVQPGLGHLVNRAPGHHRAIDRDVPQWRRRHRRGQYRPDDLERLPGRYTRPMRPRGSSSPRTRSARPWSSRTGISIRSRSTPATTWSSPRRHPAAPPPAACSSPTTSYPTTQPLRCQRQPGRHRGRQCRRRPQRRRSTGPRSPPAATASGSPEPTDTSASTRSAIQGATGGLPPSRSPRPTRPPARTSASRSRR